MEPFDLTPHVTSRQREVYDLYRHHPPKKIALLTGVSRGTVYSYLRTVAQALPGDGPPLKKIVRNHVLEELAEAGVLCEKSEGCAKGLTK